MAFALFSVDTGFVNRALISLNVIDKGVNFLADGHHMWLKMTMWQLWKSMGWNSILYLAAIAGIDQELYEAAQVDGASRIQQIMHITVPGLMPTFFVLLMLSIGNFINTGMESYFVFQNPMNKDTIEVLDLYVYNLGIGSGQISFSVAVGVMKSVIALILFTFANTASKKIRGTSVF